MIATGIVGHQKRFAIIPRWYYCGFFYEEGGDAAWCRSALPPFQPHLQPVAGPQRDQALWLDGMAGLQMQPIALRDRGEDQHRLGHRKRRSDANARTRAERNIGEARTRRRALG